MAQMRYEAKLFTYRSEHPEKILQIVAIEGFNRVTIARNGTFDRVETQKEGLPALLGVLDEEIRKKPQRYLIEMEVK
jgi:hypothetical protein